MKFNYHFHTYLTEELLGSFLESIFGDKVTSQVKIGKKMTCDYCITGPNGKLYIEFDGPYHYTSPISAINDLKKDELIKQSLKDKIIRIPYFIQLDKITWDFLFVSRLKQIGLEEYIDVQITNDWDHGFISKKIIYPASYCSLGVDRFKGELGTYNSLLDNKITNSLNEAIKKVDDYRLILHLDY